MNAVFNVDAMVLRRSASPAATRTGIRLISQPRTADDSPVKLRLILDPQRFRCIFQRAIIISLINSSKATSSSRMSSINLRRPSGNSASFGAAAGTKIFSNEKLGLDAAALADDELGSVVDVDEVDDDEELVCVLLAVMATAGPEFTISVEVERSTGAGFFSAGFTIVESSSSVGRSPCGTSSGPAFLIAGPSSSMKNESNTIN